MALEIFGCLRAELEAMGPVEIFSTKSRLGFMTRVRFCGVEPRRDGLRARLWLKRPLESPRFTRTDHISGDDWNVWVDITGCADVDAEFLAWLREARSVGDQDHLGRS